MGLFLANSLVFYAVLCEMQRVLHRLRRLLLGRVFEVRVEVCRGGEVAVTEPLLDHFHRHDVCQKQRSAAVPEIVEADFDRVLLFATGFDQRIC